ncbi:ATP-binding protein [Streptomyces sp. PT12]|uniref:sensor histidine kinase n=1 Tax=Streptomyces sp. PT12 TaxID=1510197 RepID=UPI000DE20560|nr:ATP-binding protein [Streptomyces sp. PT12]RBM17755.1 ATP-binding protein [Streptomyces sp. PT12]
MTERPPLRHALLALLISVVITGAGWLGAVYAAPESSRRALAWGAGAAALALIAAVVTAVRGVGTARVLRTRLAEREAEHAGVLAGREAETAAFADQTLPAVLAELRGGLSADSALAAVPQPRHDAHRRVLHAVAHEIGRAEAGKSAAMAAGANAAGRVQALATSMLADLREMEHRHTDETVLGDLLHLDHRTAQVGRLADSIAVLTGARSGRRWGKPIVMESILRGAMGRIGAYQRVRLHSAVGVSIAGHAAEGVMHALAELLDNAANFSPPTAEVHVYAEEVPAGVILTVEDSGLVMSEVALRRAERAVSGEPLDLATLSGTRLGLAVVGQLARKHGLTVSFRPSARGGTGALLMIPQELISRPRATATPAPTPVRATPVGDEAALAPAEGATPAPERDPAPRPTDDHAPAATGEGDVEYGTSGLPKRRRGRTLANAHQNGTTTSTARQSRPTTSAAHSPAASAARFGAFRRATRGEGDTTPPASATSPSPAEDDTP